MKFVRVVIGALAVLAILLIATLAQARNPYDDARATTRLLWSTMAPFKCSAVVIDRDVALTAKHCAQVTGLMVDNLPAVVVAVHALEDVAILSVPGLACPCVQISAMRPALDERIVLVGYLYGDIKVTSQGEYLGPVVTPEGIHYGVVMAMSGPGMSGGGVFRVYVTGEIQLVGIISAMAPLGNPALYVEVSKDANLW